MASATQALSGRAQSDSERRVIRKLFRRLVVFLSILLVVSFLDRINIGFAGLTMGNDLGLSATMFGLAAALFYVAYVIFGIPANIMLGRLGARRWIAIIMVLWGIASTCTLFATGPVSLYVLRMIVGITEAGFLPGILVYMTHWFPARYRARANALFMIAMPVTMMLGSIVSGYILAMDGWLNLRGWQWLFLLEGMPAVFLGVMAWHFLDDGPAQADWLSAEEKRALSDMMQRDRPAAADGATPSSRPLWRQVLTPVVLMYILVYFCLTNTMSAINIWTPQILQNINPHSGDITIGLLAAVPQLCTIFAMIGWSRRSDRLQERQWHTLLPLLFAAAGWVLASVVSHPLPQLVGIIMASMGAFTALAIFWTTPDGAISFQARALGIAVINAVGNLGSAFSPLLIGMLRDSSGSFRSGMWLLAALLVLGAVLVRCIPAGKMGMRGG